MSLGLLALLAALSPECAPFGAARPGLAGQEPTATPTPEPSFQEVVVVTPCRGCLSSVINAPAAVTVISSESIATAPDRSFGELLRNVPGLNSVRTSVRDWNVTARQATSTLSNSQLLLIDGRSMYLDFIGVILWDMVSVDPDDVEQIEVLRGPASVVWGANAFTGVVNLITKAPRAAEGSSILLSLASFDREAGSTAGQGAGMAYAAATSLTRALNDRLAYRISGGYSASDPLARPVGTLPLVSHPLAQGSQVGGGELPADAQGEAGEFKNRGTTQPHVDLRFDHEMGSGRITYEAGIAGSDGIIHTGIGPFNLERGSYLGHGRVALHRNLLRASVFANFFGASGNDLLVYGPDEEPLRLDAQSRTYGIDVSHSRLLGTRHILTYGGELRHDTFHISLAPAAGDRTDVGAYFQEEFFFEPGRGQSQFRIAVGARVDRFGAIHGLVFSPRFSATWKPAQSQALRMSINRAFRSPSAVNNSLDAVIIRPTDLRALLPDLPPEYAPSVEEDFNLQQRILGQADLEQESLTSYELGYTGTVKDTTFGLNAYVNDTGRNINFARLPAEADPYTEANPPPGWPLPPSYLSDLAERGIYLARTLSQYTNLGPIRIRGFELFLEHRFSDGVRGFFNYSWQPSPRPLPAAVPFPALEITLPPRNRINAGVSWAGPRLFGSLGVSYAGRAFWVDVLPHDFDGYSPERTTFDATIGAQWAGGKITTTLRGTNLANAEVQPHVFGDILKRTVLGEVRFRF